MRDDTTTRRKMLYGIGAATTVALAGCGGGDDGNGGNGNGNGGNGNGNGGNGNGGMETTEEAMETTDDGGMDGETANVRVAHMSPNAPNVDVYVDSDDPVLSDVPFGAVSAYLEVPAGERMVEITAAGDPETSVFSGGVPVEGDTDYTVAAVGELGDDADQPFEPLVLEDDNSEVADDEARLQAVHASPDAPAVDITAAGGDTVLFDGVSYGDAGTVTVPAGEYTVEIRGDTDTNDGDVVAEFDVTLEGGTAYTAFAAGYLTAGDDPGDEPFGLLVTTASGRGAAPEPEPSDGRVRVAHMSPNAPNVDVYVDGNRVLEDVPFGAVSGYLPVPATEHDVTITAAGDPDTEVFSGVVTVAADTDYTVAAIGELGDRADQPFEPLVLEDDNSEVGSDHSRLRVVHASPDAPAVDVTAAGGEAVLFDGVAYGQSGYVEVAANDYTVQIRGDTDGNDGEVVADFDVSLNGGTVYTAFASGYLTPDDEPSDTGFDLLVAQDSEQ